MKHMIKHDVESKRHDLDQGKEHDAMIRKNRAKKIDTLQTQAASLMRLNAVWGLESKGPTIDRYKATVTAEEADQGGVFKDVLDGMK